MTCSELTWLCLGIIVCEEEMGTIKNRANKNIYHCCSRTYLTTPPTMNGLISLLTFDDEAPVGTIDITGGGTGALNPTVSNRYKVKMYTLPGNMLSDTEERVLILSLIRATTSLSAPASEWRNWLVSYFWIVLPDIRADLEAVDLITPLPYPQAFLDGIKRMVANYQLPDRPAANPNPDTSYFSEDDSQFPSLPGIPEVDNSHLPLSSEMVLAMDWESLVAHAALILFIMGNSVQNSRDPTNTVTESVTRITERRARALLGKMYIPNAAILLSGDLAITTQSTKAIHAAWSSLPMVKQIVIKCLLGVTPNAAPVYSALWTTLKLLRYSGMSYVPWIAEMVRVFPEMVNWEEMASFNHILSASAQRVMDLNAVERPYYKLYMGDSVDHYPRRGLEGLILCAYRYAQTNPEAASDLVRYAAPRSDHPIVARFERQLELRGMRYRQTVPPQGHQGGQGQAA
nr:MAG: RNA-dependent RNA polymerase [Riboviria sp.]